MAVIDHLVYAVPSLCDGRDAIEAATGVRPRFGGAHPGIGTHNALASLGDHYLEVIAPDPEQPTPERPRPFGLDRLRSPGLVTFAVRPSDGESLDELVERMSAAGYEPSPVVPMSRQTPEGGALHWRLTMPTRFDLPFLIDWGDSPNPSVSAVTGLRLEDLSVASPEAEVVRRVHRALGLDGVALTAGADTRLGATLVGPTGSFTI